MQQRVETMDMHALELFLGLCRNLHFARTSEEFHVSPSALSRTIARLEAQVGHPLLARDNRAVAMTPQGEVFRRFAEETLRRYEELRVELGQTEARLAGKLTLFASVTASQSILPGVLAQFRVEHPDVQIQLETGYAVNALSRLREGCDVVVAALPAEDDPALARIILAHIPVVTIAPAEFSREASVDWQSVPLVLPTTGQGRLDIDEWLRRSRIRPNIYSEVPGNEAILSLVALGCGVGFVPRLVLDSSSLADKVTVLDAGPKLPDFRVGFATRVRSLSLSPLVRAFWQSIDAASSIHEEIPHDDG